MRGFQKKQGGVRKKQVGGQCSGQGGKGKATKGCADNPKGKGGVNGRVG